VLKTKPELLGWEGMRLRVAIRERRDQNEKTAAQSPVEAAGEGTVGERTW